MERRSFLASLAGTPLATVGTTDWMAGRGVAAPTTQDGATDGRWFAWDRPVDTDDLDRSYDKPVVADEPVPAHEVGLNGDDDLTVWGVGGLEGVETVTGTERWTRPDLDGHASLTFGSDAVYALSAGGTLRSLDRAEGTNEWVVDVADADDLLPVARPHLIDGTVVAAYDDRIVAVQRGTIEWDRSFEEHVTGLTVEEGDVYATVGRSVVAVDAATGDERWRETVTEETWLAAPSVSEGTVVALGADGGTYGVGDGAVRWDRTFDDRTVDRYFLDTVATTGQVVAVQTTYDEGDDERDHPRVSVTAYEPPDGTRNWERSVPVRHVPFAQLVPGSDALYVACDYAVIALEPSTGEVTGRWAHPAGVWRIATAGSTLLTASLEELVALPSADCEPVSVEDVTASYQFRAPTGTIFDATIQLRAGDCPARLTLEFVHDEAPDDPFDERPVTVNPDDGVIEVDMPGSGAFPEDAAVTARVRGTDGSVVYEELVDVEDYREQPANFHIDCAELDATSVGVGEEVTATLTINNRGSATGYEAELLADGDVVATKTGDVANQRTDIREPCHGGERTISHAFDERGDYEIEAVVEPSAEEGSGARATVGTVEVGGGDPLSIHPASVLAGVGAGIVAAKRLRRDED